jgi:hypothetical protein
MLGRLTGGLAGVAKALALAVVGPDAAVSAPPPSVEITGGKSAALVDEESISLLTRVT